LLAAPALAGNNLGIKKGASCVAPSTLSLKTKGKN